MAPPPLPSRRRMPIAQVRSEAQSGVRRQASSQPVWNLNEGGMDETRRGNGGKDDAVAFRVTWPIPCRHRKQGAASGAGMKGRGGPCSRLSSTDEGGSIPEPFLQGGWVIRHSAVPYRLLLSELAPTVGQLDRLGADQAVPLQRHKPCQVAGERICPLNERTLDHGYVGIRDVEPMQNATARRGQTEGEAPML